MNPKHRRAYESLMKVLTGDDEVTVGEVVSDCPFPLGALVNCVVKGISPIDADRDVDMMIRLRKTIRSADRLVISVEFGQFLNLTGEVQWGRLLSDFAADDWTYNLIFTYWYHHYTRQEKILQDTMKAMETDHLAAYDNLRMENDAAKEDMDARVAAVRHSYKMQMEAVQQELGTGKANIDKFKGRLRDGFIGDVRLSNAVRQSIIKALDKETEEWAAAAQIVADNAEDSDTDDRTPAQQAGHKLEEYLATERPSNQP